MKITPKKEEQLKNQLILLMQEDFETFCKISNINLTKSFVCLEALNGKTVGQISYLMEVPRKTIYDQLSAIRDRLTPSNRKIVREYRTKSN